MQQQGSIWGPPDISTAYAVIIKTLTIEGYAKTILLHMRHVLVTFGAICHDMAVPTWVWDREEEVVLLLPASIVGRHFLESKSNDFCWEGLRLRSYNR